MSDYKFAAQNKLRFPSVSGNLMVENLYELPLKSTNGLDLDTIAKGIYAELKSLTEESFVEDSKPSPRKKALEVSLEICKDVIKTKLDEQRLRDERVLKAAQRKKILDAINVKQAEALSQASLDDLEKKLAELD